MVKWPKMGAQTNCEARARRTAVLQIPAQKVASNCERGPTDRPTAGPSCNTFRATLPSAAAAAALCLVTERIASVVAAAVSDFTLPEAAAAAAASE